MQRNRLTFYLKIFDRFSINRDFLPNVISAFLCPMNCNRGRDSRSQKYIWGKVLATWIASAIDRH